MMSTTSTKGTQRQSYLLHLELWFYHYHHSNQSPTRYIVVCPTSLSATWRSARSRQNHATQRNDVCDGGASWSPMVYPVVQHTPSVRKHKPCRLLNMHSLPQPPSYGPSAPTATATTNNRVEEDERPSLVSSTVHRALTLTGCQAVSRRCLDQARSTTTGPTVSWMARVASTSTTYPAPNQDWRVLAPSATTSSEANCSFSIIDNKQTNTRKRHFIRLVPLFV